ncbi:hypothetical protein [Gordonia hongkongensis]|uniref:hypothetical protein n=1 Tax=Gordonia hongkongensis TaxID=1701090 RepID=UPI003D71C56C
MATTYRITTVTFGTAGAVLDASATATTYATLTEAKAAAEETHGTVRWSHADVARPQWATGAPPRPSAYEQKVIIAPAAKGLDDVLAELRRRDAPRDLDALRAEILARQGNTPAQQPSTEEAKPA